MTTVIKHYFLGIVLFFCQSILIAQQNKVDSLQKLLKYAKHDTTRLSLYLNLGNICDINDNLKYAELTLQLSDKLLSQTKDKVQRKILLTRKAGAYDMFSTYYRDSKTKDIEKAVQYKEKELELHQETGNKKETASVLRYIAEYSGVLGNYLKELDYFKKNLSLVEELKDTLEIARTNFSIGSVYFSQKDTNLALTYFEKSLTASKNLPQDPKIAILMVKTGSLYECKKNYTKANELIKKGIDIINQSKDTMMQAMAYSYIAQMLMDAKAYDRAIEYCGIAIKLGRGRDTSFYGSVYNAIGKCNYWKDNFITAIEYYNKALKISQLQKDESLQAQSLIGLANSYLKLHKNKEAAYYARLALPLRKKEGLPVGLMFAEKVLFRADSSIGDFKGAFEHLSSYIILRDKLNGDDVRKEGVKQKFKETYEKEKEEARLEQDKKDLFASQEKKKQRIILFSVIGGLLLLFAFSIFVLKNLRTTRKQKQIIELKSKETEEQKHLVEEKQKEIIESITYAKRLQEAILPPQEFIDKHIPNNFILYKPKDLVAGDFYWAEKINDLFFIAAADSTGHGVPGAMVSVVCSNALNRTVKEFNLTSTGEILDKARELVLETFEKSTSEVKDGMDISLLCIDSKNKSIFWSGANNPLWYIQDNQLKEIKADKQPIGKTEYPKPFTTHKIEYIENTAFYLFTDGFADQFGGPNGKKFKYKQFSDLLFKNKDLLQIEQSNIIDKAFTEWKGDLEQVDDVCVIGIKI